MLQVYFRIVLGLLPGPWRPGKEWVWPPARNQKRIAREIGLETGPSGEIGINVEKNKDFGICPGFELPLNLSSFTHS